MMRTTDRLTPVKVKLGASDVAMPPHATVNGDERHWPRRAPRQHPSPALDTDEANIKLLGARADKNPPALVVIIGMIGEVHS
jgi:hypothetical protein